jgi:hypothetical protein
VPCEKTLLAANAEPAAAMLRKSRLDDVVMVSDQVGSGNDEAGHEHGGRGKPGRCVLAARRCETCLHRAN